MAGEYAFISVPRKSNNAGRATGKKNYIYLFRWDDVATFTKDEKGVRVTAFQFAESKKPIGVPPRATTTHADSSNTWTSSIRAARWSSKSS